MKLIEVTDESKCCCSCRNNKRIDRGNYIACYCDKDGHYIGYIANFTEVCEEWEKETWGNNNGEQNKHLH